MPNCVAISCAGLPLLRHNATASRLKLESNFLRFFFIGTASSFIGELSFFYVKQYPSNRSNLSPYVVAPVGARFYRLRSL